MKNYTNVTKQDKIDKMNSTHIGLTILKLPEILSCQITGYKKNKESKLKRNPKPNQVK